MEQNPIGKQLLEFNKALFDQSFTTLSSLQSQNERICLNYLEKLPWLTETGKKVAIQYISGCKKYMEDMKNMADENFKKAHEYFVPADKKQ